MAERQEQEHTRGRSFHAHVTGNSPHELELNALQAAAEFFGPGVELEISTRAHSVSPRSDIKQQLTGDSSNYDGFITVHEVLRGDNG